MEDGMHCPNKATDVDHKTPCKPNDPKFWDESNWQRLCHAHHSIKTAREDGGFGNRKLDRKSSM
jgi:5-methylcytosine-specific restriction protein A